MLQLSMQNFFPIYFYNPSKTVEFHVSHGPVTENIDFSRTVKTTPDNSFLGYKVNSLFGVPACILTMDHRWVSVLSTLGYDILTYKTVRSVEWPANDYPNWLYVDAAQQLKKNDIDRPLIASINSLNPEVSTANSFGVPSLKPEYWKEDFEKTKNILKEGQLLILSLMTTPVKGRSQVDDAKVLAKLAAETSADVFEINFACPNTEGHGLVYEDIDLTIKICSAFKDILGERKLLAKIGYYRDTSLLKEFMDRSRGLISGISSTNTLGMKVVKGDGELAFSGRSQVGVAGAAIRNLAQEQLKTIVNYKRKLDMPELAILGMGGVINPSHINEYLDMGCNAVQAASALWQNPYLASEYKKLLQS